MATYYVQVSSLWQGSRWWTAAKTEKKELAEFLAEGLKIDGNEYGQGNPGDGGKRLSRVISKTRLQREDGLPAVVRAQNDLYEGWPDSVFRPRHGGDPTERVPYPQFTHQGVQDDVETLEETWADLQKEKAEEGRIDYTVRDIPLPLYEAAKARAQAEGRTIGAVMIEALEKEIGK